MRPAPPRALAGPSALRALAAAAALALAANLWIAFAVAPPAAGFAAPLTQRVLYLHVPAALAGYAAFAAALAASVQVLRGRGLAWDRRAAAGAEVAAVMTTIALLTGAIWSRVEFFSAGAGPGFAFALLGDPKFVTTAALWLVLLGHAALRRSVDEPEARARLSAAYAALGFLAVPLSYLSSRFSPHPDFLAPGARLDPGLGLLLAASVGLWLVIALALAAHRVALADALAARDEAAGASPDAAHRGPAAGATAAERPAREGRA